MRKPKGFKGCSGKVDNWSNVAECERDYKAHNDQAFSESRLRAQVARSICKNKKQQTACPSLVVKSPKAFKGCNKIDTLPDIAACLAERREYSTYLYYKRTAQWRWTVAVHRRSKMAAN